MVPIRRPSIVQGYSKLLRLIHLWAEFGSINKHFDMGSIYVLCITSERFLRKIEYILSFRFYIKNLHLQFCVPVRLLLNYCVCFQRTVQVLLVSYSDKTVSTRLRKI